MLPLNRSKLLTIAESLKQSNRSICKKTSSIIFDICGDYINIELSALIVAVTFCWSSEVSKNSFICLKSTDDSIK